MHTFISLLRGINVSGKNRLPMAELKGLFEELKFKNVTTYIQSGNVVFMADKTGVKTMEERIRQKIYDTYAYEVPILIRTAEEIQASINGNPFLKEKNIELDKLHVTFLNELPAKEAITKITGAYTPDRFMIVERNVYLYCPNGYGQTKLTNTFFENKLKVPATTRNWRTVNELLRIAQSYKL